FRGGLRELLADTLLSPTCLGRGYYDPAVLRRTVEDHLEGRRDGSRELWTLLTLELWHRAYIDQAPRRVHPYTPPPRAATALAS
ncbi:MAG: asparagine synthase-related protein, partial [Candidatus Eisenbacteria bacterium]